MAISLTEQLHLWCMMKGCFSSVEIRVWGLQNNFISADRVVRKFVEQGRHIRRLPKYECKARGLWKNGRAQIAWYFVDDGKSDQMDFM